MVKSDFMYTSYFFCYIEIRVALSFSQGRQHMPDCKSLGEFIPAIRLIKFNLPVKLLTKTYSSKKGRFFALKWTFSGCKKHLASWRIGMTWRICFHTFSRSNRSIGPVGIELLHFPWRKNRSKLAKIGHFRRFLLLLRLQIHEADHSRTCYESARCQILCSFTWCNRILSNFNTLAKRTVFIPKNRAFLPWNDCSIFLLITIAQKRDIPQKFWWHIRNQRKILRWYSQCPRLYHL